MSAITGFCIFFLSFFPLWISVLFIDIKSICDGNPNIWTEIISICLILLVSVISLIVLMHELNPKNADNRQEYIIVSAKEEKTISAEYLLSYILPLFAFDFTTWDKVVLFLVFFLCFAFLSIRHNYFSVNVLLELLGHRFYACELKNSDNATIKKTVVCREILLAQIGGSISARAINNACFVKVSGKR